MSALPFASPVHRCDEHPGSHGHHHHPRAEALTPRHFLTRNPCDTEGFSEVCACCQGAVDVDEFMGLKAAAPHDHSSTKLHLPEGPEGWTVAAVTAWATLPGIYFGVQNFRAAKTNVRILDAAVAGMQTEGRQKTRESWAQAVPDVACNWAAYAETLSQSRSMQRFISVFAGALPALGSACMLGSVVAPALGAAGGGFLLVYCLSHMTRYMTYEWPRVRHLQAQLQKAALPEPTSVTPEMKGLAASLQLLQSRHRLYPQAAASFGVYAAGATLLTAGTALPVGAGLLAVGLGAVLYLNNGPIKASYGKNGDRAIDRLQAGSQRDLLRRIGMLQKEADSLRQLRRLARSQTKSVASEGRMLQLRTTRAVRLGLSYGLTFGICNLGRDAALARLRRAELTELCGPERLVAKHYPELSLKPEDGRGVQQLYRLLYERPDEVAHQVGALLDHFHARVALEGLRVAQA